VLRLERLPTPVDVLMSDVRFVDSFGIEPLFASAHRRVAAGLPPMRITRLSNAVRRLMALLGISPDEPLDLTAWTAATRYAIAGQRG
jgi:anti-anti-sigma regulatory factor